MIEPAAFETEIAGRPVFRLSPGDDANAVRTAARTCGDHIIGKVRGDDFATLNVLLDEGFGISCASVHLRCAELPTAGTGETRTGRLAADDLPAAEAIVAAAFATGNRFANDPLLGPHARDLHAKWMRNSLNGYADACIGSYADRTLTGIATVHLNGLQSSLGLIAVDPASRRGKTGSALLHEATRTAVAHGAATMDVITETHNVAAINFYIRAGFVFRGSEFSVYRTAQ